MTRIYAANSIVRVYPGIAKTYPWHGTAPGPLTARIWNVPMRAARGRGLWSRLIDVQYRRWADEDDAKLATLLALNECVWCGKACAHPMH